MEKKSSVTLVRKVIMTLITLLVIAYVIYVICSASFTQIKTETAKMRTVSDSISTSGYFIRDEKLIKYNGGGVVSYIAEDGEKVSKNQTVANVFSTSDDANAKQEIEKLNAQITALEQLEKTADTITLTPDEIDKNISSLLIQASMNVSNGDYLLANDNINDVLYNLNERQLVTGKLESFSDKINELKNQVRELEKTSSGSKKSKTIKSSSSGYFVSTADGYEGIYSSKDIENIYPENFDSTKIKPSEVTDDVVGKTIESVYWYIACPVTSEQALQIKNANRLTIDLPLATNSTIDVTLVSLNQKTKTSDAVAILRGDYMTEEMASIRNENISVNLKTYTGIYIPKKAVHECKLTKTVEDESGKETTVTETVKGVYVETGGTLNFKQIIPIYSGEDYVICKDSPEEDEIFSDDVKILKVYDDVVVEGADLYDGKLVGRIS
ncbi:MAG: HlyD family efflux transporter periplasmic adaptor subunit [Acutalibacteraceae bacterium]